MNKGKIEGNNFIKHVSFQKAVLWMRRSLSVPIPVIEYIKDNNIKLMKFIDDKKGETWVFKASDVLKKGSARQYGQEEQWYFPILLAEITKHEKEKTT